MEPETPTPTSNMASGMAHDAPATQPRPLVLSWERVSGLAQELASTTAARELPEVLVAVGRGGLVPAVIVSHLLRVRDVRVVAAFHTVDDGVNAAKTGRPDVAAGTLGDLASLDVLILDDIAGTGKTLAAVRDLVAAAGARRIRSAVLVMNRANMPAGQVGPDYVGLHVDRWVVFPWERPEEPTESGGGGSPSGAERSAAADYPDRASGIYAGEDLGGSR